MCVRKYLYHWRRAAGHRLLGAVFGWGLVVATFFVVVILGLNIPQRMRLVTAADQIPWWFSPLVSVGFAILIVTAIRVFFVAPYRAWRMMHPLRVKILAGPLETQYPVGKYEPQRVAIAVENMAYLKINDCTVHIMAVDGVENSNIFPRFVEQFSIESGEKKQTSLMYTTFRSAPLANDNDITVAGPVSPGLGGNILRFPANMARVVSVRISIPETEPVDIRLKVWTDNAILYARRV